VAEKGADALTHVVIIGGSDAGISAALRAREVDPGAEVTVVVADRFPNYSICGLPFYLSGEVPEWQALAHRTVAEIEGQGIRLLLDHEAQAIDASDAQVQVREPAGATGTLRYDRLVIATGARPIRPAIPGADLAGVYPLHTMADSFRVHFHLATQPVRSAVIVGGGYIGLEMADALTHRGIAVTVVQRGPSILPTVDPSSGDLIAAELQRHGVAVVTGLAVDAIARDGERLTVRGGATTLPTADLVLLSVGVRPETTLASASGVERGLREAIRVTRAMETNLPHVYAAGDCVETWHQVLQRPTYLPLGTTAHKQGRVAGENAALSALSDDHPTRAPRTFVGSVGTQVVKVFDLVVARTGLREAEARAAGFDAVTSECMTWDHKVYYPGARPLAIRLTGDRATGRLLGAQIIGPWQSEVAKRIDVVATALHHEMRVDALNDLDLSYTPPVSSPWDPIQVAAQGWLQQWAARATLK
jgi:NADPH-dependent 2,4-dienoyl-CoA reductase/sulfur reductase-like enzyme